MDNQLKVPNFNHLTDGLFKEIAKQAAGQAISHFKGSFFKEGFTDSSFIAWPKRRDDATHKLLRLNQNLINSMVASNVTPSTVEIEAGQGLPYAAIQNNGGIIKIRITKKMRKYFWYLYYKTDKEMYKNMALTKKNVMRIKIPQRQYIGESQTLNKNIDKTILNMMELNLKRIKF